MVHIIQTGLGVEAGATVVALGWCWIGGAAPGSSGIAQGKARKMDTSAAIVRSFDRDYRSVRVPSKDLSSGPRGQGDFGFCSPDWNRFPV